MKWLTRKMAFIFLHNELVSIAEQIRAEDGKKLSAEDKLSILSRKLGMLDTLEILGLLL